MIAFATRIGKALRMELAGEGIRTRVVSMPCWCR